MNAFRNEHDVANAHAKLINDEKSVGDENSGGCDPSHNSGSLFKSQFHALRITQQWHSMLFAQHILRLYEDVEAISANETDKSHVDQSTQPTAVVKGFVHCQNSCAQTSFEQMGESFRIAKIFPNEMLSS